MGLNDLTLEKLIGEINGYKLKMQSLYEDYGRAAQDLQDRINVLGYNLNEQLKDVKDSISSTPQRLLTLETKYVSGEVSDQEYRVQRGEFKSLLQHNLHTIEDIKSMINVLSTIEARPLGPAEIRQASPNPQPPPAILQTNIPSTLTPRAYGPTTTTEDRNRPNSFPERPSYVAQLPSQQQPAQEQSLPAPLATWTPPQPASQPTVSTFPFSDTARPPAAQQAQQILTETGTTVQPEPSTAPPVATPEPAPAPIVAEASPVEATRAQETTIEAQATPVETPLTPSNPTPIEPTTPQPTVERLAEDQPVQTLPTTAPLLDTTLTLTPDTPVSIVSEPATVETSHENTTIRESETASAINLDAATVSAGAEDALMVKVVDEIPIVDASAAVATGAEAQLQSPLAGGGVSTEAISSVPSTPDVAQVSPSQPNAFYNVVCPKCGADVRQPAKVWELKGGKSKKNVLIGLFQCQDCRVKFREALTREII